MKKYLVCRVYNHVTPNVLLETNDKEAAQLRLQSEVRIASEEKDERQFAIYELSE